MWHKMTRNLEEPPSWAETLPSSQAAFAVNFELLYKAWYKEGTAPITPEVAVLQSVQEIDLSYACRATSSAPLLGRADVGETSAERVLAMVLDRLPQHGMPQVQILNPHQRTSSPRSLQHLVSVPGMRRLPTLGFDDSQSGSSTPSVPRHGAQQLALMPPLPLMPPSTPVEGEQFAHSAPQPPGETAAASQQPSPAPKLGHRHWLLRSLSNARCPRPWATQLLCWMHLASETRNGDWQPRSVPPQRLTAERPWNSFPTMACRRATSHQQRPPSARRRRKQKPRLRPRPSFARPPLAVNFQTTACCRATSRQQRPPRSRRRRSQKPRLRPRPSSARPPQAQATTSEAMGSTGVADAEGHPRVAVRVANLSLPAVSISGEGTGEVPLR